MVYKSLNCLAPDYLSSKFIQRSNIFTSITLEILKISLLFPCHIPIIDRNSFYYSGAVLWNNLPSDIRQAKSLTSFRQLLTSNSNTAFVENRL